MRWGQELKGHREKVLGVWREDRIGSVSAGFLAVPYHTDLRLSLILGALSWSGRSIQGSQMEAVSRTSEAPFPQAHVWIQPPSPLETHEKRVVL